MHAAYDAPSNELRSSTLVIQCSCVNSRTRSVYTLKPTQNIITGAINTLKPTQSIRTGSINTLKPTLLFLLVILVISGFRASIVGYYLTTLPTHDETHTT